MAARSHAACQGFGRFSCRPMQRSLAHGCFSAFLFLAAGSVCTLGDIAGADRLLSLVSASRRPLLCRLGDLPASNWPPASLIVDRLPDARRRAAARRRSASLPASSAIRPGRRRSDARLHAQPGADEGHRRSPAAFWHWPSPAPGALVGATHAAALKTSAYRGHDQLQLASGNPGELRQPPGRPLAVKAGESTPG